MYRLMPVYWAIALTALLSNADALAKAAKETSTVESYPIIELRQYTLKPGRRDTLIELFEREFIESQESLGVKVFGTFRDVDRPDRLVWIRGFHNMDARAQALNSFYFGPVWAKFREQANATMIDSDNVLLLHTPVHSAEIHISGARPPVGSNAPAGLVVAVIEYLKAPPGEVVATFERQVKPRLEEAGVTLLAWFTPESAPNNFPRLPVREGENLIVWFAEFADESDHAAHQSVIQLATAPLAHWLARPAEVLRLSPTSRSLMRGAIRGRRAGPGGGPAKPARRTR